MATNNSTEQMDLILHKPGSEGELSSCYKRAFSNAIELFIVTAYLTDWDSNLKLNADCRSFRIIIGKDFGITRKAACEAVMKWLPAKRKGQFMVADQIDGFHPKAVFWKEPNDRYFAIIGSSNLTRAAFEKNYEANIYSQISAANYDLGKQWVKNIEKQSVIVSEDWLKKYREAPSSGWRGSKDNRNKKPDGVSLIAFKLPNPKGIIKQIEIRREQLSSYKKKQSGIMHLFRRCESGELTSDQFYDELPKYWSSKTGDRLQGSGWERQGKDSNFQLLAQSFSRILKATVADRDDVVAEEVDWLKEKKVSTRKAFLSEMLCLRFPEEYPVLNDPVKEYLKAVKFKSPRGASEGARYIDLSMKMRHSLLQNPNHPAKNLAELDTVIWLKYGKKKKSKLK